VSDCHEVNMGWLRSSVLAVCAGTTALVITSCDGGGSTEPAAVDQVQVTPTTASVEVGQTTQLSASVSDASGKVLTGRTITWSSSSGTTASVSSGGLVTGVSEGTATITAMSEGKSGTATITVTPEPVATVEVAPNPLSIILGETGQLTATTKGSTGTVLTGRTVTWASLNEGVATVAADGTVTSVAEGTAQITATSEGESGSATVNVLPEPVETVEVAPTELNLTVGQDGQLAATTKGVGGNVLTGRTVTWGSSDEGVATVDGDGTVTAVAVGTAVITATSEGKTDTADVTVLAAIFNPLVDTDISGAVAFQSVNIPAGVTVTVTSDLTLTVMGDVLIDGSLTGDCVEVDIAGGGAVTINGDVDNDCAVVPGSGGPPLTIVGNGAFDIDGSAMASSGEITLKNDPSIVGPPGPASEGSSWQGNQSLAGPYPCTLKNYTVVTGAAPAAAGLPGDPSGTSGSPGSGFIFACNGDLALKGNVQIETQEGGPGGNGTNSSATGGNATGGDGGDGGGLFIWAFGDLTFTHEVPGTEIKNHLFTGRGGDAGSGNGVGLENDAVDPAPSGTGNGGTGGAAGIVDLQTQGNLSVDPGVLFAGPGTSVPSGGAPGGGMGGDAIGVGARGKNADDRTPPRAAQAGGAAMANGGTGGASPGLHTIILGSQTGFENIVVDAGDGGPGGEADAIGGRGGDGNEEFPDGAVGGDIKPIGGTGGQAGSSRGGAGGKAIFRAGRGGNGWIDCAPGNFKPGGDGGKGGSSIGGGGPGGAGLNPGADGTHDTDDVSNGGDGGDGAGPGDKGPAGDNGISDPFSPGAPDRAGEDGPARVELGSGSFMEGAEGNGCNVGGNFDFGISVQSDPAGHHFFIGMPGSMFIWVGAIVINPTTGEFFMSGIFPFVHVQGTWDPVTGVITASGVGTVAGFPNTLVTFTGTLVDGVITGVYQMGGLGLEPGFGGLPGGIPIFYAFLGALVPG